MSTRVQKGGLIFKPVAKGKGKAREASSTPARSPVAPSSKGREATTSVSQIGSTPTPAPSSTAVPTDPPTQYDEPSISAIRQSSGQSSSSTLPVAQSSKPQHIRGPSAATTQPSSFAVPNRISPPLNTAPLPPKITKTPEASTSHSGHPSGSSQGNDKPEFDIDSDEDLPSLQEVQATASSKATPIAQPSKESQASKDKPKRTRKKSGGNESDKEMRTLKRHHLAKGLARENLAAPPFLALPTSTKYQAPPIGGKISILQS
jgi:hypothetical protein